MKVFISHHNLDTMFARLLAATLRQQGFAPWVAADELQPGYSWTEEIDNALRDSIAVIVILSSHTRTSEYVTYEWAYALGLGKRLVPLLIEGAGQHPKIEGLQRLDFSPHQTPPWERLVGLLNALAEDARDAPTRVPGPSSRMEHKPEEVQRVPRLIKGSVAPRSPARAVRTERTHDVLIVVDVQNDFFRGGAMAVEGAEDLLGPLNKAIATAGELGMDIVFTRDWHPADHCSFVSSGGLWPAHCVRDTPGAAFHETLIRPREHLVVSIGVDPSRPGYSPFEDPEMDRIVNRRDVGRVYVAGVALEYCVQATCIDVLRRNKRVVLCNRLVRAATADPVRLAEVDRRLREEGVEISDDPLPFAPREARVLASAG